MILFYLTNGILDISFGVLWWVTKNTSLGIINGVCYIKNNINNNNNKFCIEDNNFDEKFVIIEEK
tara:strand:+ start:81 stop:275 length:195 start_codon:yes stop_codon:yes gene_type:complete